MHDVVIVGGGPVGLFLACELGLAGCSVLVLERETGLGSPWRTMPLGMRGLSAGSVEAFYRRGMLPSLTSPPRAGGHFAGLMVDPSEIAIDALPFHLPSPVSGGVMTSLDEVETILAERAAKLGVEIRRGVPVSAVNQDDGSVVVRAGDDEYAARWVVGCDGGRSTVRGLAGFDFAGTEPLLTGYVVLATVAGPSPLRPGFNLTPTGMYLTTPFEGHIGILDFDGGAYDRSQPPTRDHLQAVLRRVSGTDVTLTDVRLASTFTDRAMQTTAYRRGRVLLAGDAAHIHSPLGGQGLNLGLDDAVNLGWKLAATVRGHAPDGLLDTYTAERHPIGARVLDWSRAQVAIMRPDPYSQAIQAVMRDLLATPDAATYVYQRVSGLINRYDLGSEHPLVGRNAPDFLLEDGTRLGDLLVDGRGVLLDFGSDQRLHHATMDRRDRIRYVAEPPANDDLGLTAVLVRPDGIVAWAGDPDGFEEAAARWFGHP
jgi:2-polyprenyl-6-methoxyphenol hydroxylase-like FAD-dependent oxidoreductase